MKWFRWVILMAVAAMVLGAFQGCAIPEPNPALTPEIEKAQPKALLGQEKAARLPEPPPFSEKLAPVATGVERETRLFSLNFDNAQVGAVLQGILRDTDLSLSVEAEVDLSRPVTVHSRNSTLKEALDLVVVKGAGYAWKVEGGQLEINRFEERLFVLDYLDLAGVTNIDVGGDMLASSIESSGVTGKFQVTANREKEKGDIWEQVRKVLEGMKTSDGTLQLNPRSGLIYMADTPRKVATMVRFLEELAVSLHRQVLIEAKILEVQLDDSSRYGIDWASVQMALNPNNFSDRLFDQLNLNLNRGGLITLNQNTSFGAIVDALESQGDVKVLSNPHLSVMNGQSAVMTVGSQFPFSDITGVTRDEDTDRVTIDATIKRVVFGLQLGITPQIAADGIITINVVPTITRQEGTEEVQIPTGVAEVQSFDNPVIGLQEVATTVRVRQGESVVIGGLISEEKSLNRSGLPGLRKIPLLRYIFGNAENEVKTRELVILLKPYVKEVS